MKKFDKIITLIIAVLLCLTLIACSAKEEKENDKETETKTEDTFDSAGETEKLPDTGDETEKETAKEAEDTEAPEIDYDFSKYAGTWQYNGEFIIVDEEGNWSYTTGAEENNFSGELKYENGKVVTYIEEDKALNVNITSDGGLSIDGFSTFMPLGSAGGETSEIDMSVFEGEWYLDGNIDARFYYRVNADGSWTQFERDGESSSQVDSGRTVASTEENMFTLISEYGSNIIAEYDSAEDTMYINGDAYVHLS